MIETGCFFRKCPACSAELEIKLAETRDDITISVQESFIERYGKSKKMNEVPSGETITVPIVPQDRKCAYCFRNAIRGGVLCREHAFCFGDKHGSIDVTFPDGKPYELKDKPLCEECAK